MSITHSVGRKAIQAFDELGQASAPRRAFQQEADPGPSFPYGSEWWMGWTSVGAVVTIHNVMLHYQRGALMSEPSEFNCSIEGTTYVGFQIVFATGVFSLISSSTTDAFLQSGDGDGVFKFPVYRFVATTSGTSPVTRVEMLSDYVHGSNLGGF